MFGERHDLPHEFPNLAELIAELRQTNPQFAAMQDEYEALDEEILKIEQNVEPVSDQYAEELKFRRVHLKDKLYDMLRHHVRQ
jgi:uncharacterized protein YdcH (DUF465 family)